LRLEDLNARLADSFDFMQQAKQAHWFATERTNHARKHPQADDGLRRTYMELNEIPANYFAVVEQAAFAPAHVVDGISYSPDKMLQGRLLSYPDAHRYRLGVNYEQLPVNRCPFAAVNYQRDGLMRGDGNGGTSPNYWPNSFDEMAIDQRYNEPPVALESTCADWYDRNAPGDDDHYTQPGNLFRHAMTDDDRQHLIHNIVASMQGITGPKRDEIIIRQLCRFFRADVQLGMDVARGLGVNVEQWLPQEHVPAENLGLSGACAISPGAHSHWAPVSCHNDLLA
jgi:catalase